MSKAAKKFILQLVGGVILLIVGAVISYFIFRPSPVPFAFCHPLLGNAPLQIRCDNQSNYHKHIVWDFGEPGAQQIRDQEIVSYTYRTPDQYTVTLTAYGNGSQTWRQSILVKEEAGLSSPIDLSVIGTLKENRIVETRTFAISNTKDNHPSVFSDHSQVFAETFRPDDGYKVIEASFVPRSSNNANDIRSQIAPDGGSVTFSYRLTSGPAVDRWRGWLRGDLIVRQERSTAAQDVELGAQTISAYGSYPLRVSVAEEELQYIKIIRADGQIVASGSPGEALVSTDPDLVFYVEESIGQLILKVERRSSAE